MQLLFRFNRAAALEASRHSQDLPDRAKCLLVFHGSVFAISGPSSGAGRAGCGWRWKRVSPSLSTSNASSGESTMVKPFTSSGEIVPARSEEHTSELQSQ